MNKIAHISVRDICKIDFAQNIELNRVSIFFHEISESTSELPHDLKFFIRILSRPLKKFGGQIPKFAGHFSEFGRQIFLKA